MAAISEFLFIVAAVGLPAAILVGLALAPVMLAKRGAPPRHNPAAYRFPVTEP